MANRTSFKTKKQRGFPGHHGKDAPNHVPPGVPKCPSNLPPAAKKEWARVSEALDELGLLTHLDRAALADYCLCWARLQECEDDITKRGVLVDGDRGKVK